MPRAKLRDARARDKTPLIILFNTIIPDLATTPLHAIRGDFFFLFSPFFSGPLAIAPAGRGTIDSRAKRDYSYFDAIGLFMPEESDL